MKKLFYLLIVAAMITVSCQPKTQTVDTTAAKEAVNTFMDNYLKLWNAKDVNSLSALLADDGQFYGTDPTEIMDKKRTSDAWMKSFADTSANFRYAVEKRDILLAPDGNSAIVTEQFVMSQVTGKLKIRLVSQLLKSEDTWKIEYLSWSIIPKNDDLGKLITALQ
jgi:ketosteroid isomerase-like protein